MRPRLLEMGEQHWLGDVPVAELVTRCVAALEGDLPALQRFGRDMAAVDKNFGPRAAFDLVKAFYGALFGYIEYTAVDFVSPNGLRHDLNMPLPLSGPFDVITNIGTSEHVFDIAQVYRSMHELTTPGGLMLHVQPMTGALNHGFYSISPTLFVDLARANDYDILDLSCTAFRPHPVHLPFADLAAFHDLEKAHKIPPEAFLACVFRRSVTATPFVSPQQGAYAEIISRRQHESSP
ncbi:class I SAM-dependent methyltransferase [Magnetospira thiophila]